jgi:polygalacturonase
MPQNDIRQTFKSNQFRHEEEVTNDLMTVEFRDADPTDLTSNPMRIWANKVSGEVKYTVDGVNVQGLGTKAELEEINAQLADIAINVKYPPAPLVGAKGDGVTDDTAAIQAALNYLVGSKGELLFPRPSDRYLISNELLVGSNVTIRGQVGVIIKQSSPYKHVFHIQDNAENVVINNISGIGSAIRNNYYPTQSSMIYGEFLSNIRVEEVTADTFNEFVGILQGNKIDVRKNKCVNMVQFDGSVPSSSATGGYGVVLNGCTNVTIENNELEAERHAVYLSEGNGGCEEVIIRGNTLYGDTVKKSFQTTYEYVLKIRNGKQIKVIDNFINNGYGGIIISTPTQGMVEIRGNTIQQLDTYTFTGTQNNAAIHVDSNTQTAPCEYVSIEDNTIINIANINAIYIDNAKVLYFKQNKIINCLRVGTIKPEPHTDNTHLFADGNYFDASTTGLTIADADGTSAAFKFILFSDNIFSEQLFANPVVFGTNSKLTMQAMRNRVLGTGGYEVSARGTVEVTVVGLRFKDSSAANKYLQFENWGTTAQRPTNRFTGMCYFDTTLGKPVFYLGSGSTWVDATGATV